MKESKSFHSRLMWEYAEIDPANGVVGNNGSIFEKSNFFNSSQDSNTNPLSQVDATPAEIRRYLENLDNNQD